jgi:hypothetical protein
VFIGSFILLQAAPRPAQFREHVLAEDLKGAYQVAAVDMNRDGRPDLLVLASGMDHLVWFENPAVAGSAWRRHRIGDGFRRMIHLAARDWTGDGVPDIVLAHEFANQAKASAGVISLLESPAEPGEAWKVAEIDRLATSHRLRWADFLGRGMPVVVNAPLTGAQAEPPDYRGPAPLVYYDTEHWIRHHITGGEQRLPADEGVVHGLAVLDWDGDGRDEILTASFAGIHLYRFDGRAWSRQQLAAGDPAPWPRGGASDIAVGRLPGGRFLASLEPWHGHQVVIYTQRPPRPAWERAVLDASLVDGHTILTADLNGDGADEIVAGYRGQGRSVHVYYAHDARGRRWSRHFLDAGGIAAAACQAADLNADGRLDVACVGSATANLKWYENLGGRPAR